MSLNLAALILWGSRLVSSLHIGSWSKGVTISPHDSYGDFHASEPAFESDRKQWLTDDASRTSQVLCRFPFFLEGKRHDGFASTKNIVFHSNNVLVVEEGFARILVFYSESADGRRICNEQAAVVCGSKQAQLQLASPHGSTADSACGDRYICIPRMTPDLSYIRSMLGGVLMVQKNQPGRIAIVGLGAGTIPMWLSHVYPRAKLDVVELSADVVEAASCFGAQRSSTLQLIQDDGRKYLSLQADNRYDAIFVDAYVKKCDEVPSCLKTVEFFQMVSRKLATGGVLSMNVVPQDLRRVVGSILQAFPSNFSIHIGAAEGVGNRVVLVHASGSPEEQRQVTNSDPAWLKSNLTFVIDAQGWASRADFRTFRSHTLTSNVSSVDALRDADICTSFS